VAEDILLLEPIIPKSQRENLIKMITKLKDSIKPKIWSDVILKSRIQSHILPITNCTFDKSGECFATASYDRTVKIWNSEGRELNKLVGHKDTVFCLAFNLPFRLVYD
jgi:dynein assembly factor with WDR repeat domains 1